MAIHHASSGELIDIRPLQGKLSATATKTLFKSNHLEVSRTVLLAGEMVPPHQVPGEMTVQCLDGSVELAVAGTPQSMRVGDLICIMGGETHALKAIEDSSVLITMLLHGA
ncbi:MAG: cupin domain-containing protein [Casimicrobiaceae bacterium]